MGYYGRGRGAYHAGDYYRGARGDYYRGDLLSDLGGALSGAAGAIASIPVFSPAVRGIASLGQRLFAATPDPSIGALPAPRSMTQFVPPGPASGPVIQMQPERGYRSPTRQAFVQAGLEPPLRRRMNVCNPHALRRALRRSAGFLKFAKRYVKLTHPRAAVSLRPCPTKRKHK